MSVQFLLVTSSDKHHLELIHTKLRQIWPNNKELISSNFSKLLLPQTYPAFKSQPIFAIAKNKESIISIYELHRQMKLTRGMKSIYHTEQLINQLKKEEGDAFGKWMISNLSGYKVLAQGKQYQKGNGLPIFKPHQYYMEISNKSHL